MDRTRGAAISAARLQYQRADGAARGVRAVGLFDPAQVPLDDSDWLVRALDAGLRYVHLDAPLVRRRIHARNITGTVRGTPAHAATMARILHASLARRRAAAAKP